MSSLRKIHNDNSGRDENGIDKILGMVSQKKKFDYNAWITKATFDKEDDDEGDDESHVEEDLEEDDDGEEDE